MKTRREWVELCKITQPEVGKRWEEELMRVSGVEWDAEYSSISDCLGHEGGFFWGDSIKGFDYWDEIHDDMIVNPSKYETLPQGEISPSMGVNTKPAHKLNYKGYWIDIDPNMPSEIVEQLKECVNTDIQALRDRISADEVHINNLIKQNECY